MQGEGGLHGVSRRGLKERCSYFESHKGSQLYWGKLWIKEWRIRSSCCDTLMSRTIKMQDTLNLAFILPGQSLFRAVCSVLVASVRVRIKAITETLKMSWCLHFWVFCFFLSQQGFFCCFFFLISRSGKVWKIVYGKIFMFPRHLTLLYFYDCEYLQEMDGSVLFFFYWEIWKSGLEKIWDKKYMEFWNY